MDLPETDKSDTSDTKPEMKFKKSTKKISQAKMQEFLEAYAVTGRVVHACAIAGIHRDTHYYHLETNPAYRAAFEQVQQQLPDMIEDEIFRRAIDGESDALLMFLARGAMPDKYRERATVDVSATVNLADLLTSARGRLIEIKPDAA